MKTIRISTVALILVSMGSLACAQTVWVDDFEAYQAGSDLTGQGGWSNWYNNTGGFTAVVSSKYAFSGTNSLEARGTTDTVHEWDLSGGKYALSVHQYIPSGSIGTTVFALCSRYVANSGQEMDLLTNYQMSTGTISGTGGLTGVRIIYDQWVEITVIVDLDLNTVEEYYGGELIFSGMWSPYGTRTFQNIDLWGNAQSTSSSPVYYDDFRLTAYEPYRACNPSPAHGVLDTVCETQLSWQADDPTAKHDVYFGTSYEEVEAATAADPRGVLVSAGQSGVGFDPGRLELGRTYYWRVDETDGMLAGAMVRGFVWWFTTEPYSYIIGADCISATASSVTSAAMSPVKTIDGSGLDIDDQHSTGTEEMWLSGKNDPQPWIQYELDRVYSLDKMLVWNFNQLVEPFMGFGVKDAAIEVSTDGQAWTTLGDFEFAQASGRDAYAANTTVDLAGVEAKFVRLTIHDNWGTMVSQCGLSEVRFLQIPTFAREPNPSFDATDVSPVASLSWRAGREAASHQVFLGTDAANLTLVGTVDVSTYQPELNFNQMYFWKVAEINENETPSSWQGDVWSFSTGSFITIDDFEGYDDDADAGTAVFGTWVDGLADNSSGSQVGYDNPPYAETEIVHGGDQSMPLVYDNSVSPFFSQTTRIFNSPQNWTVKGADTLSLCFRGDSGSAPAFMEMASGSIVMNAAGADIWSNADQFRFAYKTLNGDGTIIARVESLDNSHMWAKGGVMIRQSVEPGSTYAIMPITPGGGLGADFQFRATANGASGNSNNTTVLASAPYWVKIARTANLFTGSISLDGQTWTQLGSINITMTGPVLIGLALCSHDMAIVTSAEFSNISTTGDITGDWQVAEIGGEQPEGTPVEGLYVTMTDAAGNSKTVVNPDPAATGHVSWQQWLIPLSEFTSAGVAVDAVQSLTIGVGNNDTPAGGGDGIVFIDDIAFGRPPASE